MDWNVVKRNFSFIVVDVAGHIHAEKLSTMADRLFDVISVVFRFFMRDFGECGVADPTIRYECLLNLFAGLVSHYASPPLQKSLLNVSE